MTMTKTAVLQAAIKGLAGSELEREQLIEVLKQELIYSQYETKATTSNRQVLARLLAFLKVQEKEGLLKFATCTYTGSNVQVVTNSHILFFLKDTYPLPYDKEKAVPTSSIDQLVSLTKEPQTESVTVQRAAIKAAKALKVKHIKIGNGYFSFKTLDTITNICGDIELKAGEKELCTATFKSPIADGFVTTCRLQEDEKRQAAEIEKLQV